MKESARMLELLKMRQFGIAPDMIGVNWGKSVPDLMPETATGASLLASRERHRRRLQHIEEQILFKPALLDKFEPESDKFLCSKHLWRQ